MQSIVTKSQYWILKKIPSHYLAMYNCTYLIFFLMWISTLEYLNYVEKHIHINWLATKRTLLSNSYDFDKCSEMKKYSGSKIVLNFQILSNFECNILTLFLTEVVTWYTMRRLIPPSPGRNRVKNLHILGLMSKNPKLAVLQCEPSMMELLKKLKMARNPQLGFDFFYMV